MLQSSCGTTHPIPSYILRIRQHNEQKPNEGHSLSEHTYPFLHVNSTEPVHLPVIKSLTHTLKFLRTFDHLEFKEENLYNIGDNCKLGKGHKKFST